MTFGLRPEWQRSLRLLNGRSTLINKPSFRANNVSVGIFLFFIKKTIMEIAAVATLLRNDDLFYFRFLV